MPYPLEGPDTSYAQGNVDPANFPGQFAIVNASRANIGLATGSYYHQQVDAFRRAGRHVGHYFFNGNVDPVECANYYVNNLYAKPGDSHWLDSESEPGTKTVAWVPDTALAFMQTVKQRIGIVPGIYLNHSLLTSHDWTRVKNFGAKLWLAWYNDTLPADIPYWGAPTIWQYTSSGYDHNRALAALGTASTGGGATPLPTLEDEMLLITSKARGYFVIGAGYSRKLRNQEQLAAAQAIVSKTIVGNDRQVDLWNEIALRGTSAATTAVTAALTPAQLEELHNSLATVIPHEFVITGKANA